MVLHGWLSSSWDKPLGLKSQDICCNPLHLHPPTETSALHLRLFPSVTEMKGAFHLHCSVKGCLLNSRFSVCLSLCYLTSTGYVFYISNKK